MLQALHSKPQLPSGSAQTLPCLGLFQSVQEMWCFWALALFSGCPALTVGLMQEFRIQEILAFPALLIELGVVVTFICS